MMQKYDSFEQFYSLNKENFDKVLRAKTELKSPMECAATGSALVESERLSFIFLNYMNICSDLKFGLSASVLDAKDNLKKIEAEVFRDSAEKTAAAKEKEVKANVAYIQASKVYNELHDIRDYLEVKYQDFNSTHYYYKNIAGAHNG